MRKNRMLKSMMAVLMSMALLAPGPAVLAEEVSQEENVCAAVSNGERVSTIDKDGYLINDSGILESYAGDAEELVIPDTVKEIRGYAFANKENIRSVVIPNTVTEIGNNAFEGCINLEEITIAYGLTKIKYRAFSGCVSLSKIEIPESVTFMEHETFKGCSKLAEVNIPGKITKLEWNLFGDCIALSKIEIPDNITSIGSSVFGNCTGLTEIEISANVEEISSTAFAGCSNLTRITVAEENSNYAGVAGGLYNKEKTEILAYPGAKENVTIPEGITKIGSSAFSSCEELTSVELPDSVTAIGSDAFSGCSSLKKINIPDSVEIIEESAFQYCASLPEIILPFGITEIKSYTFKNCSGLKTVNIPDNVEVIGMYAFQNCSSLDEIKLPEWLKKIQEGAFSGCKSLTSIDIPEYVTEINSKIFSNCGNLERINVSEDNLDYKSIDGCLYNGQGTVLCVCPGAKTEIKIPDGVSYIGNAAFSDCNKLSEVKIPWSVICIGDSAFGGCNGLTSISLSENITEIWDFAFIGCENLRSINIPSGVTRIPRWTFLNCKSLERVSIAAEEIMIGDKAFYGCSSLTGISFQGEIGRVGSETFKGCDNLTFYGKSSSNVESRAKAEGVYFSAAEEPWTVPSDISVCKIALEQNSFPYTGSAQTPEVYLENGDNALEENKDYTVSYKDNINVGTGQVIITGTGNYTGTVIQEFTITGTQPGGADPGNPDTDITNPTAKELSSCQITVTPVSYTYDGTAKTPAVTVKDGTATLKAGTHYKTEYKDNIKVGTAKVILTGIGNYKGTVTKTFQIQSASQNNSAGGSQNDSKNDSKNNTGNLSCGKTTYKKVYGDKPFTLSIALKDSKAAVTCASSNKKVVSVDNKGKVSMKGTGIAVITVQAGAVGNYKAESIKITVEVSPKRQAIKSLKAEKGRKLKVSWKKDKQATGYQIQYSTDNKLKKGSKTVNIRKNKTIAKTIPKLKAGKKYYVRARSYKDAKINGKTRKLYGAWSKVKTSKSVKNK